MAAELSVPHSDAPKLVTKDAPRLFKKTKVCKFFIQGACTRGTACSFAHSNDDLIEPPELFCTQMCRKLRENSKFYTGKCLDPNCRYAHHKSELRQVHHVNLPDQRPAGLEDEAWDRKKALTMIKFELQNEFRVSSKEIIIDRRSGAVMINGTHVAQVAEDLSFHYTDFGLHQREAMERYLTGWLIGSYNQPFGRETTFETAATMPLSKTMPAADLTSWPGRGLPHQVLRRMELTSQMKFASQHPESEAELDSQGSTVFLPESEPGSDSHVATLSGLAAPFVPAEGLDSVGPAPSVLPLPAFAQRSGSDNPENAGTASEWLDAWHEECEPTGEEGMPSDPPGVRHEECEPSPPPPGQWAEWGKYIRSMQDTEQQSQQQGVVESE